MTTTTDIKRFNLGIDCSKKQPHTIRVTCDEQEWVLSSDESVESHHPMDRVGGQFCIHRLCEEGADDSFAEHWWLAWIVDCAFPSCILVRGDGEQSAYENLLDWLGDANANEGRGNYGMIVDDQEKLDLIESGEEVEGVDFTGRGVPVDMSNVVMKPCTLKSLEF